MTKFVFNATEYSVCSDCLHYIAYGEETEGGYATAEEIEQAIQNEIGDKDAAFSMGVAATEDDPDAERYEDEFSIHDCELCGSHLAGQRHGVTMLERIEVAKEVADKEA